MAVEKHYTTKEAAPLLALRREVEVRELIHSGLLRAKRRPVPRKPGEDRPAKERPRYMIPESAIAEFLESCPTAGEAQQTSAAAAAAPAKGRGRSRRGGVLKGVQDWG